MPRVPKLSVPVAPKRPLRVPAKYKMYNVFFKDVKNPNYVPKYVDTQVMAPNERMARYYYKKRLGPGLYPEFEEAYGPFYPSEEAQMHNPRRDAAYRRAVENRKQELMADASDERSPFWWQKDENPEDYFEGGPAILDDLDSWIDRQARKEIDDWLEYRQDYRLPIKPRRMYSRPLGGSQIESVDAFDEEGASDRFRMRGVPESDLQVILPPWRR